VKDVEAQAHRAINDDCLLGVFAHLGIQRDDEHLSLRLWCAPSKPIFDLPSAMTTGVEFILSQSEKCHKPTRGIVTVSRGAAEDRL
jgi:hypothetical protein